MKQIINFWEITLCLTFVLISCSSDSSTPPSDNMPAISFSCTLTGSALCDETADALPFFSAIFEGLNCEGVFDSESETTAVAGSTASCTSGGCEVSISSNGWIIEETDEDITATTTGTYAVVGFIDANNNFEESEDIDSGDIVFCSEITIGASSSSFDMDDDDIVSF